MQAEAKERKEGSLKEVALLSMELDELRSSDFENKYEDAKEQVRHLSALQRCVAQSSDVLLCMQDSELRHIRSS